MKYLKNRTVWAISEIFSGIIPGEFSKEIPEQEARLPEETTGGISEGSSWKFQERSLYKSKKEM